MSSGNFDQIRWTAELIGDYGCPLTRARRQQADLTLLKVARSELRSDRDSLITSGSGYLTCTAPARLLPRPHRVLGNPRLGNHRAVRMPFWTTRPVQALPYPLPGTRVLGYPPVKAEPTSVPTSVHACTGRDLTWVDCCGDERLLAVIFRTSRLSIREMSIEHACRISNFSFLPSASFMHSHSGSITIRI
jgi:hypothetical protein